MADDNREIVMSSTDELDDAFGEWDDDAPIARLARGSQSHTIPDAARTLADPVTTSALAQAIRRPAAPSTLEEALLALADELPERLPS
jgi:hypothetical protein